MKPLQDYLDDLLVYIVDIETFTATGQEAFNADKKTQLAVMRGYEVIGEIIKRLPQPLLDAYPQVEWKAIKGFRDFLIHQYDAVDLAIVWNAVEKLPVLKAAVSAMRADLPDEAE